MKHLKWGLGICAVLLMISMMVYAAPGDLDPTFDGDGKVITNVVGLDIGNAVVTYPGNRLIVAGLIANDAGLLRYNQDGSLDTSFGGGDGIVTIDLGTNTDLISTLIVNPDGKILAGGYNNVDFALARFNADGSPDTTFSTDGKVTTSITASTDWLFHMMIDSNNKIVAAGFAAGTDEAALVRYNQDGSLDTTFSGDGIVTTPLSASSDKFDKIMEIGGKYFATGFAGTDFALVRYNMNGSLDTSFGGGDGIVTTDVAGNTDDFAASAAVDSNGKILVIGQTMINWNEHFALVRYNQDGSLDTTFGGTGIVVPGISNDYDEKGYRVLIQQPGNHILAVGTINDDSSNDHFLVTRLTDSGSLDTAFGGGDGIVTTIFSAGNNLATDAVLDTNNRLVVVGYSVSEEPVFNIIAARYDVSLEGEVSTATPTNTDVPETATATATNISATATATSTLTSTLEVTSTATVDAPTSTPTEVTPTGNELVQNGGFELKDGSDKPDLTPWTPKNLTSDKVKCDKPDKPVAYAGTCAFTFKGQIGENSQLVQIIDLNGVIFAANDTLTMRTFIKATNAATSGKIKLRVTYGDNPDGGKLNLNLTTAQDYTELQGTLNLKSGNVSKIKLQIKHSSRAGKVYLDEVSLTSSSAGSPLLPLP